MPMKPKNTFSIRNIIKQKNNREKIKKNKFTEQKFYIAMGNSGLCCNTVSKNREKILVSRTNKKKTSYIFCLFLTRVRLCDY